MDSKKTLVLVLLVTIALSLLGTYSSLQRISGLKELTGAWESGSTTRGSVNLTISSLVSINFTNDRINFGSGYVTVGSAACYLETNTVNVGCTNFNSEVGTLVLENQGNVNVKLNLTNVNNSQSFIGGTNPGYAWRWTEVEGVNSTTCINNSNWMQEEGIFRNITTAYAAASNASLCGVFNATDSNDVINISFKILIPSNAPSETGKFDTWTATAVA